MRTDPDDTTLFYDIGYADTDAGGIVYHARYIEMAERARNRLMYAAGYSFARLAEEGVLFIVRRVEAVYHAPAWLEDRLALRSRIGALTASRSTWVTEVRRGEQAIARIDIDMVAVDRATRRAVRHPQALAQALARHAPVVRAEAAGAFA
ncbi:MAG: thioesterase family protein [Burkholderia sp.]